MNITFTWHKILGHYNWYLVQDVNMQIMFEVKIFLKVQKHNWLLNDTTLLQSKHCKRNKMHSCFLSELNSHICILRPIHVYMDGPQYANMRWITFDDAHHMNPKMLEICGSQYVPTVPQWRHYDPTLHTAVCLNRAIVAPTNNCPCSGLREWFGKSGKVLHYLVLQNKNDFFY